jgi:hypothetical protein
MASGIKDRGAGKPSAEEIEETPVQAPAAETSTVDRAARSLSRSLTEQVLTLQDAVTCSYACGLFNCGRDRSGYICRGIDSGIGRSFYNLVLPLILAFNSACGVEKTL